MASARWLRAYGLQVACLLVLALLGFTLFVMQPPDGCPEGAAAAGVDLRGRRIFLSAVLRNAAVVFPRWGEQVALLAHCVRERGGDLEVTVWSNNNTDGTDVELSALRGRLRAAGVAASITTDGEVPPGVLRGRVLKLAYMRNLALSPPSGDVESLKAFHAVVFVNDVLFTVADVFRLLRTFQNVPEYLMPGEEPGTAADAVCGLDIMYTFYDRWVSRTLDGQPFSSLYPFVWHSMHQPVRRLAWEGSVFPVKACWNGLLVTRPQPLAEGLRFRIADAEEFRCGFVRAQSECLLFALDLWERNYTRHLVDPSVRVFYAWRYEVFGRTVLWALEGLLCAYLALPSLLYLAHPAPGSVSIAAAAELWPPSRTACGALPTEVHNSIPLAPGLILALLLLALRVEVSCGGRDRGCGLGLAAVTAPLPKAARKPCRRRPCARTLSLGWLLRRALRLGPRPPPEPPDADAEAELELGADPPPAGGPAALRSSRRA